MLLNGDNHVIIMEKVSVVITSCGRPDLLKKTIETFLQFNTYPIEEWFITEDSGSADKELVDAYPWIQWIVKPHRGQIACIDDVYSRVKTPYIFHLEDDWETYASGMIQASFEVMSDKVSAVMCRAHDPRVYHMSDTPPMLNCWGGWGHYSFNPGLRRTSDFKTLFRGSFSNITKADGLTAERAINDMCREMGLKMALCLNPDGYIRHIGDDRHVVEVDTNKAIKIGLNMIVKDESHVILESLNYTLPLIDTYCIVDTGSTDNTIEIIKNFYKEKGIPGEVHQRPWKDFGHNRSEALKLCDGKMDYILVIDADDIMQFPSNGRKTIHTILKREQPDCALITFKQVHCQYKRAQIFKANDGWMYKGVLHEYPTNNKKDKKEFPLPDDIYMTCRHTGARNLDPNKKDRDINVLLKGVAAEPDNERYVFYLAMTYRDYNMPEEAVHWYKKRFEMGKWTEEMFVSGLWITRILNSKEWAWKAHEANPCRIESLVSYMSYCRANSLWSRELLSMALYASSIPKPTNQMLFLEPDAYDWKVWDELSIIAFYCGDKALAKKATLKLLKDNLMPADQRARIEANLKYA
jgi:glycosyltransferase involved in cell wall biosynthesis